MTIQNDTMKNEYRIHNTLMLEYCTCDTPEPEEIERGVIMCLICEKEIEYEEDVDLMHDSWNEDITNFDTV